MRKGPEKMNTLFEKQNMSSSILSPAPISPYCKITEELELYQQLLTPSASLESSVFDMFKKHSIHQS